MNKKNERGISHFIEHILFEGTEKRPNNREISNEIEKIGGDFNAYTTNERTCFYIKVLKKHFKIAVDVLADIFQNSLFKEEHIAKEKNIILKEISMVYDEPRFYQWVLLQKNLFKQNPCKYPTYGDKKVIKKLGKKDLLASFKKYYVPNNIIISVVGDVPNWRKEIKDAFQMKKGKQIRKIIIKEREARKSELKKEKRNIVNTYLVVGFKAVPQKNKDSYVLEVVNAILGRGQSGRIFNEIRSKRALAYEVGTQHVGEISYGYFAVYATIDKKNVNIVRKLILEEINKLKNVTAKDLQEAKDYIEGDYLLELEDSQKVADQLLFWEQVKDANLMNEYLKRVKEVKIKDIQRVIDKYFKYSTTVVLEGK